MKAAEKNNKLELEYSDIFKYHPNWVIRWGITIVTFLILLLIISTIYIDDSEIVKVKAELISNNTQIVYSHNNYNNYKILIDNNSYVIKGTYLILLDSTVSIKEVVRLSNLLSIFGLSESNSRFYFEDLKSDCNNIRALKPYCNAFYEKYYDYVKTYSQKEFSYKNDVVGLTAKYNYMKESFDSLKTRLDKWIDENSVKAEISGFLVYNQNDNQIKSGDKGTHLLTIQPLNENKEVTCKLFFSLSEKEKLAGKTNYDIKLHISENGKSILFNSDIGNVYYDKDKNMYTAEVSIKKEHTGDLFSGLENRISLECKADIVVENKSLFSSLFEKYKNIKKM
jgi:hypothetical protein